MRIVSSGLQPGDRVVTEGISKARDGVVVSPKPDPSASSSREQ
jgi:multidrug efflux pump subunit AcrA (membrane-fusion protein)